ncbi:MAG TPA: tetratricopeptide repeat protein [Candidatus Kapabacteria bacterium]|nr:tetratricopeptide repeat protein [Candidatus Kapabacteria bacterium]
MKIFQRIGLLLLIGAFAAQIAGCGAAEVSSAKLYRTQRNYVKADELLTLALKRNGADPEAWALYVQNLYDLNKYERLAEVIDTAYKYAVDYRTDIDLLRFNTWVALYNGGVGAFEQNPESPDQQRAALALLESAVKLMPERAETYMAMGQIYEAMKDEATAVARYKEALNQTRSVHDQGVSKGLMLRMSTDAVQRALGAPATTRMVALTASDSAMVYGYPASQTYVYFERAPRAPRNWQLTGWRMGVNEQIGGQPMRVSTEIYKTVANYYYQRGLVAQKGGDNTTARTEFDQALPYLFSVQRLDPSDELAASFIPDIYIKTNQSNKAKEQYERLLAETPSKALYTSYGTFLLQTKDYEAAVNNYLKALEMDPNYESALFNIAASYKNWAAAEQAAKKPNYKAKLEESTKYFERLLSVDPNEFTAMQNLAENYDLLGQKDKFATLVTRLEALKNSEHAQTAVYWNTLGTVYSRIKGRDKDAEDALRRADALR